jgi:hypothetical protein
LKCVKDEVVTPEMHEFPNFKARQQMEIQKGLLEFSGNVQ